MQKIQLKERLYFIGDIHAQHSKLVNLLDVINFDSHDLHSSVLGGQLVFVGDLIDNKSSCQIDHLALLNQVESLVKRQHAFCLLGNHECNAIGWATKKDESGWARPHTPSNRDQHYAFLDAVKEGSDEHARWLTWFKGLPLFIDFESVKAIHACWDEQAIARIKPYLNSDNSLKDAHWVDAFDESHELYELCETLLKGPERVADKPFTDKTGKIRTQERIKWWSDSAYQESSVPIFIGHYTLQELPQALSKKVICVDYNAAKGSNPLVCCQFDLASAEKPVTATNALFHYSNNPK